MSDEHPPYEENIDWYQIISLFTFWYYFKTKLGKFHIKILFSGSIHKLLMVKSYYQLCIDKYAQLIK